MIIFILKIVSDIYYVSFERRLFVIEMMVRSSAMKYETLFECYRSMSSETILSPMIL